MKICPICDHELNAASFCPVCRRVVKKPWIISDGIYLNKVHSGADLNCDFHRGDRKSAYLNQRHKPNEKACSYHSNSTLTDIARGVERLKDQVSQAGISAEVNYLNLSRRLKGR